MQVLDKVDLDAIREELVTSVVSFIGPKPNLLGIDEANPPLRLEVSQPVLDFEQMETIRHIEYYTKGKFKSCELDITYPLAWGKQAIEALEHESLRLRVEGGSSFVKNQHGSVH